MKQESGLSMIEVLVAGLLVSIALIPLMQLYPGILGAGEEAETETRLGVAAVRKMDEILTRLRTDILAVPSGGEACLDPPACRVQWTVGTEAASGVMGVGSLLTVTVVACRDANANLICDAGETRVQYDAKVTSRP